MKEHNLAPTWGEDWAHYQKILKYLDDHPELPRHEWTPQREFLAQLGERAFSLETGHPMRQVVGPDGGWDFEIDGERLDVKARWGRLQDVFCVTAAEDLRAHYYVKAMVDRHKRVGWIVGGAYREEVARPTIEMYCGPKNPGRCIAPRLPVMSDKLYDLEPWMYLPGYWEKNRG